MRIRQTIKRGAARATAVALVALAALAAGLVIPSLAQQVSAVFSGPPYLVGPTITPTTTVPEAGEYIAVDPNNYKNLLAVVNDFAIPRAGYPSMFTPKYAFSSDNGATWVDSYVPLDNNGWPITADGQIWLSYENPVVAVDLQGNAYVVAMGSNGGIWANAPPVWPFNNANGLYVSVTTLKSLRKLGTGASGGFTAAQVYPVATDLDPNTLFLNQWPWIAVDNSRNSTTSGNVYVSWTRTPWPSCENDILLSRSTDHGKTWSAPIRVSAKNQGGGVYGSQVAVGPKGEVYVVYFFHGFNGNAKLYLTKSTDGGVTFSRPVAIISSFNTLTFDSTYLHWALPALAASPASGNVYVLYSDQPNKSVGAEVEFIRSTDGGATFSAPVVINDVAAGHQFMAAITVDSAGVIHASWFDTRNSPTDSSIYDIYAAFSEDDGATFSPNARVTASSVNADGLPFIGFYMGIAAGGGFAHPVWCNGGAYPGIPGFGGLQTATLTLP